MVVVGSLNEDLALHVAAVPAPGQTVLGDGPTYRCGGKGANQAVAASRCGAEVVMIGCVGTDTAGDRLLAALTAASVAVTGIQRVDGPSGLAVVVVAADGENAIVASPGANAACTPDVVLAGLDGLVGLAGPAGPAAEADGSRRSGLGPADVVVAQGEIPVPAILAAAAGARSAGARFVLNLAPPVDIDLVSGQVDLLVVNEHEAADLVGADTGTDTQSGIAAAERHATVLAARLGGTVVLTLGGDGVLVADGDSVRRRAAYPPARVVDTTGAGDAFVGALAAALAQGQPVDVAVSWGAAAGSITVAAVGAQSPGLSANGLRAVLDVGPFGDAQA